MARIRMIVASILAAAFLLLPMAAHAAGPVLAPSQIIADNFDSAMPARTIVPVPLLGVAPSAYWGVVTQSHRSGSSGLWCAGSVPWAAQYPSGTRGAVYWNVPQLADYYSSDLSFWYTMPAPLPIADADNFWVRWETAAQPNDHAVKYPFPTTSLWSQLNWDLSSNDSINMSRQSGTVEVWFENAPGGDPTNPNIGSATGQGPTIDDLSVTGWKFGPVRDLHIAMSGTTAHITWNAPPTSTNSSADDTRSIAYRVYREVDGSDAWVELTSGQITDTSFDDDTSALKGTYRYVVQAEDQGTVTGYGEVVLPDDSVLSQTFVPSVVDTTPPVTTNNAPSGTQLAAVTVTLLASDPGGSGVASTFYRLDSASAFTTYTAPIPVVSWGDHTLYYYSVDAAGNQETPKSVKVSLRQPTTISVTASPSSGTRRHAQTLYGYITPGAKSYKVKVQYQKPGNSKWYTVYVNTVASGSKGKWSYRYTPTIKGTYHWKASWAGNSTRYTSTSKTLSVKVK